MNIAWIAGFFDGEGCVHIAQKGRGMRLCITQKNRDILDLIKAFYGFGTVVGVKTKFGTVCHSWRSNKKSDMLRFLRSIRQYSICKRKDIEIGLLYLKTIDEKRHGSHRLNTSILARRENLRTLLKSNRK